MAGRRSEARRYALLALYQWELSGLKPAEVERHFLDDPLWFATLAEAMANPGADDEDWQPVGGDDEANAAAAHDYDLGLFTQLLRGVPEHLNAIHEALRPALDRSLNSLDPVERAILRIGVYELLFSPELPVRVIINEGIELAKSFAAVGGHRYVNGVLDRVAKAVRAEELSAAGAGMGGRRGG